MAGVAENEGKPLAQEPAEAGPSTPHLGSADGPAHTVRTKAWRFFDFRSPLQTAEADQLIKELTIAHPEMFPRAQDLDAELIKRVHAVLFDNKDIRTKLLPSTLAPFVSLCHANLRINMDHPEFKVGVTRITDDCMRFYGFKMVSRASSENTLASEVTAYYLFVVQRTLRSLYEYICRYSDDLLTVEWDEFDAVQLSICASSVGEELGKMIEANDIIIGCLERGQPASKE